MTTRNKERLGLGALCLVMAALAFAGRNGRFGGSFDHYSWGLLGCSMGWLGKTFLPVPEKWDAISYGIRIAACLVAIVVLIGLVGFIGGLSNT